MEHLVTWVQLAYRVQLEVLVQLGCKVLLEIQDILVHRDLRAQEVLMELLDFRVAPDPLESKVRLVMLALPAVLVRLVRQGQLVQQETQGSLD
jgi:hypothetical protein